MFGVAFFFFLLSLAVLGLHCCAWAFSSCSEWGLLFVALDIKSNGIRIAQ